MGYSCTQSAHNTLEKTLANIHKGMPDVGSNTWINNGQKFFYDRGREQADGSITGSVFVFIDTIIMDNGDVTGHCRRFGSIKILANGQVKAWAGMPKEKIIS